MSNEAGIVSVEPWFKRCVLQCCPDLDVAASEHRFNADIYAGDQMFTHSLHEHGDLHAALSQYFNIALQQYDCVRQLLAAAFAADEPLQFLDFACGYGRLLRFLAMRMPRERLFASELQTDALDFVGRSFGVQTLPSCTDPNDFNPGRSFDFIWVASLFSHLPEHLFEQWLKKLHTCLSPRGVLCFSIRGAECLGAGTELSQTGILYQSHSENAALSTDIYGTTYVSEAYVADVIAKIGAGRRYYRLRRALAHEQDVYVLAKDPQRELPGVAAVRRGVWGWLDRHSLTRSGELYLEGWAASLDGDLSRTVEVTVDGEPWPVTDGISRPDVSAALAEPRVAAAGWVLRRSLRAPADSARIEVIARAPQGTAALVYAGTLAASEG